MGILTRRPVVAWALYDWANSAFATTVMAGFFPVFFGAWWSVGVHPTVTTFRLSVANTAASIVIAVFAPLIGAIADKGGARVRLLALFTVLGAAMTAGLFLVERGDWATAAILYAIASVGFAAGNQFCDSLITDVSEPEEYDIVSAYGYALGYLGGGILFLLNVIMYLKPGLFGIPDQAAAVRVSFVTVAIWWLVFSVPLLLFVREKRIAPPLPWGASIGAGLRELSSTLRHLRADRTLLWFLLAYWLYIDGVFTIIKMAVDYGSAIGLEQSSLITALLLVQFIGFPAALAFGWLGKRLGPRTGIFIGIAVYAATSVYGYFLESEMEFYALAVIIGLVQGGVQSLSRSLYGRLVPEGKAGEFFGLYNMVGKFGAIIGPLLMGGVGVLTGDSRMGIVSVVVLFVLGAYFLSRVDVATVPRYQRAGSSP